MRIILGTENQLSAMRLRDKVIKSIRGEVEGVTIKTWSYIKSSDNFDIVYHNIPQYIESPEKNVVFRLQLDGSNVVFSTAWWKKNPEPTNELFCLHVGRLTEMLLCYFKDDFIKFIVVE